MTDDMLRKALSETFSVRAAAYDRPQFRGRRKLYDDEVEALLGSFSTELLTTVDDVAAGRIAYEEGLNAGDLKVLAESLLKERDVLQEEAVSLEKRAQELEVKLLEASGQFINTAEKWLAQQSNEGKYTRATTLLDFLRGDTGGPDVDEEPPVDIPIEPEEPVVPEIDEGDTKAGTSKK